MLKIIVANEDSQVRVGEFDLPIAPTIGVSIAIPSPDDEVGMAFYNISDVVIVSVGSFCLLYGDDRVEGPAIIAFGAKV
ncbi:hypothetical protein [Novosphingobium sp. SG720]|uniref:hypothetical protein n=1 Tax=Novosphingobium sp. SG720 TaxID=2586998 RepID=UPI001444FD67|nr:hypothetical protein [Novosphingobium sp. SG720]NKJ40804.1 hypothetical protein [Novosphingobium sp. SG720]